MSTTNRTSLRSQAPTTIAKKARLNRSPLAARVATSMLAAVMPRNTTVIAVPTRALASPTPPATITPIIDEMSAMARARAPP